VGCAKLNVFLPRASFERDASEAWRERAGSVKFRPRADAAEPDVEGEDRRRVF
jgi:hypothetical protein